MNQVSTEVLQTPACARSANEYLFLCEYIITLYRLLLWSESIKDLIRNYKNVEASLISM